MNTLADIMECEMTKKDKVIAQQTLVIAALTRSLEEANRTKMEIAGILRSEGSYLMTTDLRYIVTPEQEKELNQIQTLAEEGL